MKSLRRTSWRTHIVLAISAVAATACSPDSSGSAEAPDPVEQGRVLYQNICIACHNGNPALDGSVGPAVAGASEALLTAKMLNGDYPKGYTPKRPGSAAMPRFPQFAEQIPALAAYLASIPTEGAKP